MEGRMSGTAGGELSGNGDEGGNREDEAGEEGRGGREV